MCRRFSSLWLLLFPLLGVMVPSSVEAQGPPPPTGCSGLSVTTTPTGVAQPNLSGPYSQTFTVTNCSTGTITAIALTCEFLSPVSCGTVSPTSWPSLAANASFSVTLGYSVGAPGVGQAYLRASWGDLGGTTLGVLGVTVYGPPTITLVPISTGPASRAVVRNRMPIIRALITPQNSAIDTTKTVLAWRSDTITKWRSDSLTVARWNRGVIEWAVDSVRGINGAGADSALITVSACSVTALCTTVTRWAVIPNDSLPVLGFTGVPVGSLGSAFSAPFGPGLAVSGAELETGVATIPYFSMNAARSLGLTYSTRQSYPRAIIPVDLELRWPLSGNPTQIVFNLYDSAGTKLDSLTLANPTCATGAAKRCRTVLQADFSSSTYPTPVRKWLRVEANVTANGATKGAMDSVEVVLVDRRTTMYGSGWWPNIASRLVGSGNDRLLIGAAGSATVFRGNGDSLYLPPPGSFVYLAKTTTGWSLRARGDSAEVRFDALGRISAAMDRNGNLDSLVYKGTTDTLWKVRDPVASEIVMNYTAGKLSSIATGARSATVTVSGGLLTTFTPASGGGGGYTSTFAYQAAGVGTGTVLLQKRIGVIGDTSLITYDPAQKNRPVQATLPRVKDESGADILPTLGYTPLETRGIGAVVALDSSGAYVELRDPRNNWVRSWPDRWGLPRLTWDSLGRLSRSSMNGDGFVRWSEGKIADSTRSWIGYDSQWRAARRFIVRPAGEGGVLRVDSLVYDANHRVIQRIDARGQVQRTDYDAKGNAIHVIQPNVPGPDTTWVWYRADGLVDSTRAPTDTNATIFKYAGAIKTLVQTITPSRDTVERNLTVDAFGRTTRVERKVPVSPSKVQWRRTETFYSTSSNLVDSTRIIRTINCDTPCASPTWPTLLDSDTLQVQRVRFRYDRAGRDSLRINDRGVAMLTVFDRLGRVTKGYPYGIGVAEVDSFAYDAAGNLKKTWTRRGHLITADYDSRGRDTLQVVPTIGTLHKAYAGPLDQMSRVWVTGLVDSVGGGGAKPDLSFVYDRRGRLRADTAWAGSAAQITTYFTDRYERDSVMHDPLGDWKTKYETTRGRVDTLVTPLGDTLILSLDHRGRIVADTVRNAGLRMTNAMSFTSDGTPKRWSTAMQVPSTWAAGADDQGSQNNMLPALQPVWTQKRGLSGAADTLKAELYYDGWERLGSWDGLGSLAGGVTEAYNFDRAGNMSALSGEVFDPTTNRLLRRANGVGRAWTYTYDAAGNLTQAVDSGTSSVTYRYAYDALDRLVRVDQGATLIARYAYDVTGRRIAKHVYSAATGGSVGFIRFVYHGGQVGYETDSLGAIGMRYVWGPGTDNLVAFRTSSLITDHYYVATDKLGSVHQIIKRDGTWAMTYAYAPYGSVTTTAGSGPALRYRWTGREYDAETGWYFHRARYYEPGQKRFVQEDPAGFAGGDNLYAYVNGSPLGHRDPTGHAADSEHFRSISPPECCHVGFTAWTTDFDDNGIDDMGELLQYVWTDKCNLSSGCIKYVGRLAKAFGKECSADAKCSDLQYRVSHQGRKVTVAEWPGDPEGCTSPCPAARIFLGGEFIVDINGTAIAAWAASRGLMVNGAIVLGHELAHVEFDNLTMDHQLENYRDFDTNLAAYARASNGYALYWENQIRGDFPGGGNRSCHNFSVTPGICND